MTGLEVFFNPSARHVQEERERARLAVDDADSGDPPFGVDLDRGTVVLPRRPERSPADPAEDQSPTADPDEAAPSDEPDPADGPSPTAEPSPGSS